MVSWERDMAFQLEFFDNRSLLPWILSLFLFAFMRAAPLVGLPMTLSFIVNSISKITTTTYLPIYFKQKNCFFLQKTMNRLWFLSWHSENFKIIVGTFFMHRYNRDIIWTVLTSTFIIYLISYIWSCASQAKTKQNKNNRHQRPNSLN